MTGGLEVETLDELVEIIEGVRQDLAPQMQWAEGHLERLTAELRESEPPTDA